MGRLMSPDEAAGNLMLMGGFVATGLALPWLADGWHAAWSAPTAVLGVGLVVVGLRRLRDSR